MSVGGTAVANGGSASLGYGVSTSVAATPASGYSFAGWTVTSGAAQRDHRERGQRLDDRDPHRGGHGPRDLQPPGARS